MNLTDDDVNSLADSMELEIKQIKDSCYRYSWYMRGGVSVEQILYDTDLEDHDIIQRIIKDNVENTKNAKMPLI